MTNQTRNMVAIKPMRYKNRQLAIGDKFETTPYLARQYAAVKLARVERDIGTIAPPPRKLTDKVARPVDALAATRAEYQEKVGKRPFMGWDEDTLRAKMAEADAPEAEALPVEPEATVPEVTADEAEEADAES